MRRLEPANAAEMAEAVAGLRASSEHAVVVGGGTMLAVAERPTVEGGDHAAPVELSTGRLDDAIEHEPADLIVTCGAGTRLADLEAHLAESGQTCAIWHPDPGRATIGGLVAAGWQSPGRALFGRFRDRILQVEAVTGEARRVTGGGKVVKNVTGFDLPRLFCGSLGTLAVLTRLSLKVLPRTGTLHARRVRGDHPDELLTTVLSAILRARQPVEALLAGDRESGYTATVFAPGPSGDAQELLGPVGGEEVDDAAAAFGAVASDPIQCPQAGSAAVVRAAMLPGAVPSFVADLELGRLVADIASGVVWAELPSAGGVRELRSKLHASGGSLVLVDADPPTRRREGTFWSPSDPPPGLPLMERLKRQFDPDDVLGRGRLALGPLGQAE